MTSGKASRKAKQNPAPPGRRTPTKGGGGRQASPKVLMAAGAVVVAIVVAIVLGVVLSGGDSGPSTLPETGSLNTNLSGAAEVEDMLKGIPQSGMVLGAEDAPVTLTQFIDLQCPACRSFETSAFPEIVEKWVKPGKLRVETQAWAFIGPDSVRGQKAVIAAGNQGKASNFAALLYGNQGAENAGWLDDDMVGRVAAAIPGMNVQQLLDDRSSSEVEKAAAAVDAKAAADGVNSTPTLFIGKTGEKGTKVELTSLEDTTPIDEAIQKLLGEK
jgi:protein-disulfide isomerase